MQKPISLVLLSLMVFSVLLFSFHSNPMSSFEEAKKMYAVEFQDQKENTFRFGIYLSNLEKIQELNRLSDGKTTYQMNQFVFFTQREFKQKYFSKVESIKSPSIISSPSNDNYINWVKKGAVTDVKSQGAMGSAWPFGVQQNIQTLYWKKTGSLKVLSSDYIYYCCPAKSGGFNLDPTYSCLVSKGMATDYPPFVPAGCHMESGDFKISSYKSADSCDGMVDLLQNSPVTADADASNWQFYRSGILSNCGTKINHSVSVVGYEQDSWTVKNCWGKSWGEGGFIRLSPGNTCGICFKSYSGFL